MLLPPNIKRYLIVFGGACIYFAIIVAFTFGNYVTYIISYLHYHDKYTVDNVGDENWIMGPYPAGFALCFYLAGYLIEKIGEMGIMILGTILHSSMFFLTYFTIQYSLTLVILSYGLLSGTCGIGYVYVLYAASRAFPKHEAKINSLLLLGGSVGGTIFNMALSFYINPNNLAPGIQLGSHRLFNQTEVVERVPSSFLLVGSGVLLLQLFGTLLIFLPSSDYEQFDDDDDNNNDDKIIPTTKRKDSECAADITPTQLLKDPGAYILWLIVSIGVSATFLSQFIYKSFGQTFISDDHYLASIGSVFLITSSILRIVVAILVDKYGIKLMYLVTYLPAAVLLLTMPLTQYRWRGWYFMSACFLYTITSVVIVLAPAATQYLYGSKHFIKNYALIFSGSGIGGLIIPFISGTAIKSVGWNGVFFIVGAVVILGFVLSIFLKMPLLPYKDKKKERVDHIISRKE